MTLTAEQSSNKAEYEAAPTAEIIDIIRTAMGEGCIHPCHVYDAVDELICRIQALEHRPPRNCDVGTAEERMYRYNRLRDEINERYKRLGEIPPAFAFPTAFEWEDRPYEEGGAK